MDGVGDGHLLPSAMHRFSLRVSALRAEASALLAGITRTAGNIELIQQMARRVRSLDEEIAAWLLALPPNLRFKTLCWLSEKEVGLSPRKQYSELEVFPGRVDMYPDFVTSSIWNTARTSRLILASLNIRIVAWLSTPADYRTTAEYATSKAICEGTIADVIASVPYHLGWHVKKEGMFEEDASRSGFACGEEGSIKALPAWFLIWALTCVKNHDMATEAQRSWVKGRLRFIADHVGLKYANIVNDVGLPSICALCVIASNVRTPTARTSLPLNVHPSGRRDALARSTQSREIQRPSCSCKRNAQHEQYSSDS